MPLISDAASKTAKGASAYADAITLGKTAGSKTPKTGGGDLAKSIADTIRETTAAGSSGQEISQEDKPYGCPEGAFLTFEANGSGNHVCQWRSTGEQFAVQPRSGGGGGGGGGGGASTGGSSGVPGQGASTGSDYLSGPGADIFARNPQAMAADMLEQLYPGNEGLGLYNMLAPYGDAMNVLFLAERGQDAEGGSKEDFLTWLEGQWNNLMTPGASMGDPAALWANILSPEQNSPLAAYLAVQNPEDQARNFRSLAAGIAGTYYHPLFADAVMDRLAYGQDAFLGEAARGATDPFYDWIQASMPYLNRMY